ncbi:hypothetical protein Pint_15962 [Pistacia integerrima]|uniref:Uncharacterized protein n=1 Tax=Pistacia integerrima TaxID=434235 RepID=A0ACC0ZA87_9ROSI|nr:hypothetical protein Pint_15962 [Pistacia integerrima]
MASLVAALELPSKLKPSLFVSRTSSKKRNKSIAPVARLFGPAIFEASKLKVLFLGERVFGIWLQLQGWYNRLQRDEVVAEWKKVKGKMSLHVHCHISGGHFLLDLCARLRFLIFCKELPVVLKAFVHGDGNLLNNYPELQEALVWVYFHSNIPEFNRVECWGPLKEAVERSSGDDGTNQESLISNWELLEPCRETCNCCFPPMSSIPWSQKLPHENENHGTQESIQQQI